MFFGSIFQKQKAIRKRGKYYASFKVDPTGRADEFAPEEILPVQEDAPLDCLDSDNPDRWVVSEALGSRPAVGRLNAVCLLDKPVVYCRQVTSSAGAANPREQFREEVLTISNKKQEALMKRRLVKVYSN